MFLRFGSDPFFRSLFEPDDGGGMGGSMSEGDDSGGDPTDGGAPAAPAIDAAKYAEMEKFYQQHSPHAERYQRLNTVEQANPQMKRVLDYMAQFGRFPPGMTPQQQRQAQQAQQQQQPYKFFKEGETPDKYWEGLLENPLDLFERGLGSPKFSESVMKFAEHPQFQQKIAQAVIKHLDELPAIQWLVNKHKSESWQEQHGGTMKELETSFPEVAKMLGAGADVDPAKIMNILKAAGVVPKNAPVKPQAAAPDLDDEEDEEEPAPRPSKPSNGKQKLTWQQQIRQGVRGGKL